MKKAAVFLVLFCMLAGVAAWAPPSRSAEAAYGNPKYNAKKAKYNKNALPPGWRYEAGYTLWRARRNFAANRVSYRKYRREKTWFQQRKAGRHAEEIVADALDWTADEIAKFWEEHKELLEFHPSGVVK
jgi:hypothetical protein